MSLEQCRDRLPIWTLWGNLGLPDADKVRDWAGAARELKVLAPFRSEKTPSCSLKMDGAVGLWKDFGSGDGGDEVGLIENHFGLSQKEAIAKYHELAGVEMGDGLGGRKSGPWRPSRPVLPVGAVEKKPPLSDRVAGKPLTGKKPKAEFPRGGALGEPVAVYQYKDERGRVVHETLRFEPKTFRQRRPAKLEDDPGDVRGGYVWSLKDAETVIYRLPEVKASRKSEPIFLVEGEKDVELLEGLSEEGAEVIATTVPMGSGKWKKHYGGFLRDRWVVIIPDFDGPGLEGAEKVARELFDISDRVGILFLDDLWSQAEPGHDIGDWVEWCGLVEMHIDEARGRLMAAAEKAGLEGMDFMEGTVYAGGRGGYSVLEDKLARSIVRKEGLIFCGDHFWQWRPECGLWKQKREKSWIERRIKRELVGQEGGETVVTSARVKSVVKLAETERVRFPEELNRYPEGCFPVANGLLDVDTGKLFPHRHQYLTTVQTPHPFIAGAECPEWLKWLEDRQEDEATRAQLQEIFGYCLGTGINFHSFFFLYGDGGTGKSTCVDVLEWLVGSENKVALQLDELDNPFLRSQLVGKSLYLAKELTTRSFKHIGLIKAIVSGDPVSVDVKYGTGFDFRPKGRLVMESNVIAATPDSSGGFERRFIQINFDKVISSKNRVYGFQDRFKEEMPGILNWALAGYKRLRDRGRFEHTERSEAATRDLLKHRAGLSMFLKEGFFTDREDEPGLMIKAERIFELYQDWCEVNDVVAHHKELPTFNRELFSIRKDWRSRKVRRCDSGCEIKRQWVTGLEVDENLVRQKLG